MQIRVNTKSNFWDDYITVTRKEDDFIVWCNHAGAYDDEAESQFLTLEGVKSYTNKITICDKCPAWNIRNSDEQWVDAPFEGIK